MKSTSKVIMGAIVVMVVCLALVLCLILVLLAELYCSLLIRRRRQLRMGSSASSSANTSPTTNTMPLHHTESEITSSPSALSPLPSYYSHGVLQVPRNLVFPVVSSCKDSIVAKARNQLSQLHQVIEFEVDRRAVGNYVATSPPPTSLRMSPRTFTVNGDNGCDISGCTGCAEHLVYISNPIYDNDANRVVDNDNNGNTPPFETPHSSPSCLEICGSSSSEEEEMAKPTPPLTPMKKLPTEACSVSLRDATSLGTSGSDSVNNDMISSSSSASPSTSPSW